MANSAQQFTGGVTFLLFSEEKKHQQQQQKSVHIFEYLWAQSND